MMVLLPLQVHLQNEVAEAFGKCRLAGRRGKINRCCSSEILTCPETSDNEEEERQKEEG